MQEGTVGRHLGGEAASWVVEGLGTGLSPQSRASRRKSHLSAQKTLAEAESCQRLYSSLHSLLCPRCLSSHSLLPVLETGLLTGSYATLCSLSSSHTEWGSPSPPLPWGHRVGKPQPYSPLQNMIKVLFLLPGRLLQKSPLP